MELEAIFVEEMYSYRAGPVCSEDVLYNELLV